MYYRRLTVGVRDRQSTHLRIRCPKLVSAKQSLAACVRTSDPSEAGGGLPAESTCELSAPTAAALGQQMQWTGSARLAQYQTVHIGRWRAPQSRPNVDSLLGSASRSGEKNTTWSRPARFTAYIAKSALTINDWVVCASLVELLTPMLAESWTECS